MADPIPTRFRLIFTQPRDVMKVSKVSPAAGKST